MKTRGLLGFVGASFLLFAVGSVLTMSAYAGTGSAPPPPPPPPPTTSNPPPPQTTTSPPVTTTATTTTTTPTQTSSGASSSGTKVRVHHKVKQHTQTTHKKKHPANTTPQTDSEAGDRHLVKPKAIVPVPSPSHNGVLQFAAVAAIVAAALVVLALLALVISVAVVRMRSPHGAHGGNIKIR